jgi:hypothetical protein
MHVSAGGACNNAANVHTQNQLCRYPFRAPIDQLLTLLNRLIVLDRSTWLIFLYIDQPELLPFTHHHIHLKLSASTLTIYMCKAMY